MSQWRQEGEDEQVVRGFLGRRGRVVWPGDDIKKSVVAILVVSKVVCFWQDHDAQTSNILLMDEPTNHKDKSSGSA